MTTTTLTPHSGFSLRQFFVGGLQLAGATLAFSLSLMIASLVAPMAANITAAAPPEGFLPLGGAFLFNGIANAVIVIWAARRSSFRGLAQVAQLATLSFGAQVFMTQIETAYFISAFPLLHGNFEVYGLVLRGFITSVLFAGLVTLMTGGFSKAPRPSAAFTVTSAAAVTAGAWLAVVYVALYMLFGYYVAWQSPAVRLFYAGPAELNSFFAQWGQSLMARPEILVFQYFRGGLWMLCLIPLILGFTGKRVELILLCALALGLLPTAQLAFPNPLMPADVSLAHFWEVALSTGLFGALTAWALTQKTA